MGIAGLGLLAAAILRWTMIWALEPGILMSYLKIVVVPVWLVIVLAGPPTALAGLAHLIRRSADLTTGVFVFTLLPWGYYYLLTGIARDWSAFMDYIERVGPVA